MSTTNGPRRTGSRSRSDAEALTIIATLLGANEQWDSGFLESIADVVSSTGRPHPGDPSASLLAAYRRAADRLDIEHDGEESS